MNTVYGVSNILARGHYKGKGQQAHDRERIVKAEDGAVDVNMTDFRQVLESAEDVQHFGSCESAAVMATFQESFFQFEHRRW